MTRLVQYSNNATSKLAANLTAVGLTCTITPGDGAKFPTLTGAQYFYSTLIKVDGTKEIVKVTARATDTFTIVRAAEPIAGVQTSYAFSAGDKIELRPTAGMLGEEFDRLHAAAYAHVSNKSANYSVLETDLNTLIRMDSTTGTKAVTLPLISTLVNEFECTVAKVSTDGNAVNINASGADVINGVASTALTGQYQAAILIADKATNTWTLINSGSGGSGNKVVDTFVGAGTAGPFTLSGSPGSKNNTDVYVGGVYQRKATYTLVGTQLTLGGVVAPGVNVECEWAQPVAIGVPGDGTVTTAKLDPSSYTGIRTAIGAAVSGANNDILSTSALASMTGLVSVNSGQLAGLRNVVINGSGLVQQRVTAPTLTAALQYGVADRHLVGVTGGTGVAGTVGVLANTGFSCGVGYGAIAASWTTGQFIHKHRIEAANTKQFNGKTVTVSGKLYQDTGGSRNLTVSLGKPTTTLDTFSAVTNLGTSGAIAVPSSTVTPFSYTLAMGATDASLGLEVLITDNAANTVVSKNYLVSDLQVEIGSVATVFEQRPFSMEKSLCERYWRKSYNYADAPGAVTSVGAITGFAQTAPLASGFYLQASWPSMRSTPTIVLYSPSSGASGNMSNAGTDRAAAAVNPGETGTAFTVSVSSNASQHSVHYTASAEL